MAHALYGFGKGFFSKAEEAQYPVDWAELLLKDARKCMERAGKMTLQSTWTRQRLRFNRAQCEYLAHELNEAVDAADILARNAETATLERTEPRIGIFMIPVLELLLRHANEVESFIQECCEKKWIQAAVRLQNTSELVVQLSLQLKLCIEFCEFAPGMKCDSFEDAWRTMTTFESRARTIYESVKEKVAPILLGDLCTLVKNLEDVTNRSINCKLTELESQLGKSLYSRLTQRFQSGSVQFSSWKIENSSLTSMQRLAAGSFGEVHKSSWLGLDVAEKKFIGPDPPTFMDEVKIMAGLNHPNIVPLFGFAEDKNRCSIVMELIDMDLRSLMEERKHLAFTLPEAVDLMLQSAEGMRYLHEKRVVHRDLKAQNIMVQRRKDIDAKYIYVKVADFGLSRTKVSSIKYSNLTLNRGTTRWMAPELMPPSEHSKLMRTDNDPNYSDPFKVDVYSFGMVCYEILTRAIPFSSIGDAKEVRKMVLNGDRPQLPDYCPQPLKTLIHLCWNSEANSRPSFVEICKQLRCLKHVLMIGLGKSWFNYG